MYVRHILIVDKLTRSLPLFSQWVQRTNLLELAKKQVDSPVNTEQLKQITRQLVNSLTRQLKNQIIFI